MAKKKVYHYTTVENLAKILKCGQIKVSEKLNGEKTEPGVWLSTNPDWDYIYANGLPIRSKARIEIQRTFDRVVTWDRFKIAYGLPADLSENIERLAFLQGSNPNDWFIRYMPIYSGLWECVEVYKNGRWVKYKDPEEPKHKKLNAYEIAKANHLASQKDRSYDKFNKQLRNKFYSIKQWI
jgi:hypothetical protein